MRELKLNVRYQRYAKYHLYCISQQQREKAICQGPLFFFPEEASPAGKVLTKTEQVWHNGATE